MRSLINKENFSVETSSLKEITSLKETIFALRTALENSTTFVSVALKKQLLEIQEENILLRNQIIALRDSIELQKITQRKEIQALHLEKENDLNELK
jgi:hypothetical protein